MQGLQSVRLYGTTSGAGSVTVTSTTAIKGWLYAVKWIDGTLDNNNTAALTVTNSDGEREVTLLTVGAGEGDADAWYQPRTSAHDSGCAALGTTEFFIIDGVLSLAIASGGAAHSGGCIVYYFV